MRRGTKQVAANCLHRTGARRGLTTLLRRAAGGTRVLIVAYHRVVPEFEDLRDRVIPALLTSVPTFERQLAALAKWYRIAPLGEALDVLAGRARSDRDLCVVTFDDGYADFHDHALPVLRRLGVPAVLYVPTAHVVGSVPLLHDRLYLLLQSVEKARLPRSAFRASPELQAGLDDALRGDAAAAVSRLLERWSRSVCIEVAEIIERTLGEDPAAALRDSRLLTWDELRAVHAAGVEIGGHTIDHACLHNESRAEVIRQLRTSKAQLERELGSPVVHFAYPNGWYSQLVVRALQDAGYRSAVTTEDRLNPLGENPFVLRRKVVWEFTSRGVRGFSPAVAACIFGDAFAAVGLSSRTAGEKPVAPPPGSAQRS